MRILVWLDLRAPGWRAELKREFQEVGRWWLVLFPALLLYWTVEDGLNPGVYGDPWWPCASTALILGGLARRLRQIAQLLLVWLGRWRRPHRADDI